MAIQNPRGRCKCICLREPLFVWAPLGCGLKCKTVLLRIFCFNYYLFVKWSCLFLVLLVWMLYLAFNGNLIKDAGVVDEIVKSIIYAKI